LPSSHPALLTRRPEDDTPATREEDEEDTQQETANGGKRKAAGSGSGMSVAKKQHATTPAKKQKTAALVENIFPPTSIKVNRLSPLWAALLLLGLQPQHFFSYRVQLPNVAAPSTYLGFYGALHLILFRFWLAGLERTRDVSDWPLECRFDASTTRQ
jgi:hypothetical protein